jgi:hypothetical protein
MSRGHAACKFIKTILQFYGNTSTTAHLFTDKTMNEHSRSIDIRHHAVRQDYIGGEIQIGGVKTTDNPSDILTNFLPAPPTCNTRATSTSNFPPTILQRQPLNPQQSIPKMATTYPPQPLHTHKHNNQHTVGQVRYSRLGGCIRWTERSTSSRRGGCGTVVRVSACTIPPLTSTVKGLVSHPPVNRDD